MTGASLRETGSTSLRSPEPASGLSPSGNDPARIAAKIIAADDKDLTAENAVRWAGSSKIGAEDLGYMLGQEIRRRKVAKSRKKLRLVAVDIPDDEPEEAWNAVSGGY